MYTFMTDHLPKTDINLCHRYIATINEQLRDESFLAEWRLYEHRNLKAHKMYFERSAEIGQIERRYAKRYPKGVAA